MPTPSQIKTIQLGRKCCGLNDASYRTLLKNVAGVGSSKQLDNRGVEDVLAVLEDLGFDSHPQGASYWRNKVKARGSACGERMAGLIHRLADGSRYDLAAMVRKQSDGRTDQVEQLLPREAWKLIEALKAIGARENKRGGSTDGPAARKEDAPLLDAAAAAREGGTGRTDAGRKGSLPASSFAPLTDEEIPF